VPSPSRWARGLARGTLGARRSDMPSFEMLANCRASDRWAQAAVRDEPKKKYVALTSPVAETGNSGPSSQ